MPIGIDIEKERSKIHRIATKFLHTSERLSDETDRFRTTQWYIKEAAYKVFGKKGVSFLHHIRTTHMNAQHPITEVIADSGIVKLKNWTYHWPGFSCALSIKEQ
jgi:phosphopantetheinyl transferase